MRLGVATAVVALLAALPASAGAAPATKRCPDDKAARCGVGERAAGCAARRAAAQAARALPRLSPDRSLPAGARADRRRRGRPRLPVDRVGGVLPVHDRARCTRRHDLIVVDNRGTGRSGAINCPRLQAGKGVYAREVGRCARRLGRRANAYGTGAAADDLAAVLDKLHAPRGRRLRRLVRHLLRPGVRGPASRARAGAWCSTRRSGWTASTPGGARSPWRCGSPGRRCAGAPPAAAADVLAALRRWALRLETRPLAGVGRRR